MPSILDPWQRTYRTKWNQGNQGSPFSIDPQAHYPQWIFINSTIKISKYYFIFISLIFFPYNRVTTSGTTVNSCMIWFDLIFILFVCFVVGFCCCCCWHVCWCVLSSLCCCCHCLGVFLFYVFLWFFFLHLFVFIPRKKCSFYFNMGGGRVKL